MSTDVLIIGSGPAGYTAAIYAARAGFSVLVIEGDEPGGQLSFTTDVENYPGFPSIKGPDLMIEMRKHAISVGANVVRDTISKVDFSEKFMCYSRFKSYSGRAVILATGASPLWLGLDSEKHFLGYGVSSCATCDGPMFRDQDIVVVGGGNTAMEMALTLSSYVKSVKVVHRRDKLRAEHALQRVVMTRDNVSFVWNSVVDDIVGSEDPREVTGVMLRDVITGENSRLDTGGVFIAIGHRPNTDLFAGILDLTDHGSILLHDGTHTSIPGVFAAGDVADTRYRQAVTAAGMGCQAALDLEKYINLTSLS